MSLNSQLPSITEDHLKSVRNLTPLQFLRLLPQLLQIDRWSIGVWLLVIGSLIAGICGIHKFGYSRAQKKTFELRKQNVELQNRNSVLENSLREKPTEIKPLSDQNRLLVIENLKKLKVKHGDLAVKTMVTVSQESAKFRFLAEELNNLLKMAGIESTAPKNSRPDLSPNIFGYSEPHLSQPYPIYFSSGQVSAEYLRDLATALSPLIIFDHDIFIPSDKLKSESPGTVDIALENEPYFSDDGRIYFIDGRYYGGEFREIPKFR